MSNYIIMKNIDGEIVKGERKQITSSKPYFTDEDNCLTEILNAERLEENNKTLSQRVDKNISISIKSLMGEEKTKRELTNLVKRIKNSDSEIKTMELINYIENQKQIILSKLSIIVSKLSKKNNEIAEINYLKNINRCYETLLNKICDYTNENGQITEDIINTISNIEVKSKIEDINNLIKGTANNPEKPEYIKSLFEQLSEVKTREDLTNIYNQLIAMKMFSQVGLNRRNSLRELHEYDSDLALSVMSKTIIINYIDSLLMSLHKKEIFQIESDITNGANPIDILLTLDQSLVRNVNPEVALFTAKLFADRISEKLEKESDVICYSCTNGYTSRCKKIADIEKQSIENYPFIVRGFQVYRNERLDKFIVSECENFDLIPHYKKLDDVDFRKARRLLAEGYADKMNGLDPVKKALSKTPKRNRIS